MGVPNWNGEDLEEIEVDQTEVSRDSPWTVHAAGP